MLPSQRSNFLDRTMSKVLQDTSTIITRSFFKRNTRNLPAIRPAELESACHSAAVFERASPPGHPPVPVDTYRLVLTLINGVERPGLTPPRGIAWPKLSLAATVASAPQRRQYPRVRVSGRAIRVVGGRAIRDVFLLYIANCEIRKCRESS